MLTHSVHMTAKRVVGAERGGCRKLPVRGA